MIALPIGGFYKARGGGETHAHEGGAAARACVRRARDRAASRRLLQSARRRRNACPRGDADPPAAKRGDRRFLFGLQEILRRGLGIAAGEPAPSDGCARRRRGGSAGGGGID